VRRLLDNIYYGAGVLAGCCLVGICALVLVQIGGRLSGVFIRGTDQFAGYLLAGATFFALAYTFGTGGHIRVALVLENVPASMRRIFELICLCGGAVAIGYFAWHAGVMTWQSYVFKDVTHGLVSIPMWIPQSIMPLGLGLMFIAIIDALVQFLGGHRPGYLASAEEHGDLGSDDTSSGTGVV
jgi:TRAP-type C4-dicarboxylate transport system permease small subunit